MMLEKARFPTTTASFRKIRQGGMYYVDKTEMVWQLAHESQVVFLSRPRRFGKSMLLRTMASYLGGERELFEGLRLDQAPRAALRLQQADHRRGGHGEHRPPRGG